MKKEASGLKGKKLWLWIAIGVVAVAVIVAGIIFLPKLFGGNNADDGTVKLYWNIDREANTDPDTGLSIRKPADDGNYYVRFAHNGEQVELPVADKKLVNFIDSMDLMGLTLDSKGFVVDVKAVADIASVIGESLYVQSINGDTMVANSAIMMNGRKITIKLSENVGIYNVSGKGEFVGQAVKATDLSPMDTISVYGTLVPEGSEEEPVVTHIFVLKQPAQSKVYWRADQYNTSALKETARVPDENGVYTIPFWVDGEYVELKCKDKAVVDFIDAPAYYWCHFGLEFDAEGYIVEAIDSFIGSRTLLQCERYDITMFDPSTGEYTAENLIKNNGASVQGTVGEDCPIWEVSKKSAAEGEPCRKIDSLQVGDRVCIWTDTMGNPVLIYVAHRLVDVPAYWNVTKSWDSTNQTTTRTPNADGVYTIEMLTEGAEGGVKTKFYTKNIEHVNVIDGNSDYVVGMKVDENNNIIYVYDPECLFGYTYFCRGYYIIESSSTVCTFLSPSGSGAQKSGVLNLKSGPYNVSAVGNYGEKTEFQYGDLVYSMKNAVGEVVSAYVTRRALGDQYMFWNLDRMYDSSKSSTTREPNIEDGYYTFTLMQCGRKVIGKTMDKAIATEIDSYSAPGLCITFDPEADTTKYETDAEGNKLVTEMIITGVYDGNYAYGGTKWASRTVVAIDGYEVTIRSSSGSETTFTMDEDTVVTNVSISYENYKGEVTDLRVGDYVNVYRDTVSNVREIYVRTRQSSHMAWPVEQMYDHATASTTRQPNADGWYEIKLAIDGVVKTYKTKNPEMASAVDYYSTAFGVLLEGDIIKGASAATNVVGVNKAGLNNNVVTKDSDGKTVELMAILGAADVVGTTQVLDLAEGCKIIDTTPGTNQGKIVALKKGDTLKTYLNDEGKVAYIFVIAHEHAGGYKSKCSHCGKEVYWNAYTNNASISANNAHYYLPYDVTLDNKQMGVYDKVANFEAVLDLNGHTLSGNGKRLALIRYGDTLTIFDSTAVKDANGNVVQLGTGMMKTKNNSSNGGVFMVSGDATYGTGVLNIESGTFTVDEPDEGKTVGKQGGIIIVTDGIVNMKNGLIIGGRVNGDNSKGATGGNIRVAGTGVLNVTGGKILNGYAGGTYIKTTTDADGNVVETETRSPGNGGNIYAANSAVVNLKNCEVSGGNTNYRGGNIYAIDSSKVTIGAGVKVDGGYAEDRGGNIYNGATLTIDGGEITNGVTAGKFGGNIMSLGVNAYIKLNSGTISGGSATNGGNISMVYSNLIMTGGTITEGSATTGTAIYATESGGQISTVTIAGGTIDGECYVSGAGSEVTISGGNFTGDVKASSVAKLAISGAPKIAKLVPGARLQIGEMTEGADITIDINGTFTQPFANAAAYVGYFHSSRAETSIVVTEDGEIAARHDRAVKAYCADCDAVVYWTPWTGEYTNSDHYILEADMQLDAYVTISDSAEFVLDLNGYTITAPEAAERSEENGNEHKDIVARAFYVSGMLTVMDNSEAKTGMITGGRASRGGNIYVTDKGTFKLYSGTISGGVADNTLNSFSLQKDADGNPVKDEEGNDVYVQSTTGGRGGNIFSNGKVALYGGAVVGGSTNGGSQYGGNICSTGMKAEVYVGEGAVVADGKASSGANIMLMYSNLNVDGGEIRNGAIYTNGTNTGGYSAITITDGVVDATITLGGSAYNVLTDAEGKDYLDISTKKQLYITRNEDGTVTYVDLEGNTIDITEGAKDETVVVDNVEYAILKDAEEKEYFEISVIEKCYLTHNEDGTSTYIDPNGKTNKVYLDYRTALTITGGTITKIDASKVHGGKVAVSGAAVISELKLGSNVIGMGEMSEGASICVDKDGIFTTAFETKEAAEAAAKYIVISNPRKYEITVTENNELSFSLKKVQTATKEIVCEHCGQTVIAQAWNGFYFVESGHYYLDGNLNLEYAAEIEAGLDVTIDLNGYTVTAPENNRVFYVAGNLNIVDSSANETGLITGGRATRGGNVYVTEKGTFNLYGGTIADGVADNALGTASNNGRGGNIFANGIVNLYGGKVINGSTVGGSSMGGNVMMTGLKAMLYVDENASIEDGAIYLMYSNLTVNGGVIRNAAITATGTASGGKSTVTVNGGIIDATITLGGGVETVDGVAVDYRGALVITGGTFTNIDANKAFENKIAISGDVQIAKLTLGKEIVIDINELSEDATIYLAADGIISTAFANKEAAEEAAKCFVIDNPRKYAINVTENNELTFGLNKVVTNTKEIACEHCGETVTAQAWNGFYFVESGHYYLEGALNLEYVAIIEKGLDVVIDLCGYTITAPENERTFYIDGGKLSIVDSSVEETGVVTGGRGIRGGNVYVSSGSFSLYSGTIANGVADNSLGTTSTNGRGGNIFSFGDVYLYGGKVIGGSTVGGSNQGGNIMMTGLSADLYISENAYIADGTAKSAGNISLMYANMIIDGGEIRNGSIVANGTASGGKSTITINGGIVDATITLGGGVETVDEVPVDYRTALTITGGTITEIDASKAFEGKVAVSGTAVVEKLTLGKDVLLAVGELAEGASIYLVADGVYSTAFETKEAAEAAIKYFVIDNPRKYEITITENNELSFGLVKIQTATKEIYCEHCGQTVTAQAWNGFYFVESGHYYLDGNLTLEYVAEIEKGLNVVVDLNGYTLTAGTDLKVFDIYGDLSIVDSSEAKTGTITGGRATRGGNIYVQKGGNFTLYGGTIENGVADNSLGTSSTGGRGGNIFGNGGNVTLKGGAVIGGSTNGGNNWGGNIFMTGGVLTVEEGVVISGGTATTGNNIYLMYAEMVMNGGNITEGDIYTNGTDTAGNSSVTINGGIIDATVILGGGTKVVEENTVDYRTALVINGGTITKIDASKAYAGKVSISGAAVITELKLGNGIVIELGEMTGDASITLDAIGIVSTAFATKDAADAAVKYLIPAAGYHVVVNDANELVVELIPHNTQTGYCDHCQQEVEFTAWDGYDFIFNGHYFLEGDLQLEAVANIAKSKDVIVDLNGYTITAAENSRVFYIDGGRLTIVDSSENETGVITGGHAVRGGNIYVSSGKFYLYSGTIANGVADNALGTSTTNGRGGNIFSYGDVYLYGGKVIGGSTNGGSNQGGNIMITDLDAELVIDGAYIADGTSGTGANISVMYSNLIINSGEIRNGSIYTNGTNTGGGCTVTINGGIVDATITLGGSVTTVLTDDEGKEYCVIDKKNSYITYNDDGTTTYTNESKTGDLYLDYRTVLTITGGTVTKIDATKVYENKVVLSGAAVIGELVLGENVIIEVGEMVEGAAIKLNAQGIITPAFENKEAAEAAASYFKAPNGHQVAVNAENQLEIKEIELAKQTFYCEHCKQDVEFTEFVADGKNVKGGHYFLAADLNLEKVITVASAVDFVLELNGKTITANDCRAFSVGGEASLSIQGEGTITGGNSKGARGGNIYASGANLYLYGGTIINGTATGDGNNEGNNVAVYNGIFTMNGNVVIGNAADAEKVGHSIYLFNTTETNLVKGTVVGRVLFRGVTNVNLGAGAVIDVLALRDSKLAVVEERAEGAQITVKITDKTGIPCMTGAFTVALENADAVIGYFVSADAELLIINDGGVLKVSEPVTEPEPSEPTPSEPEPSEPEPSEPTPSEPTPSEPEPSEPTPSEPEPSEPTPSEPVEPEKVVKTFYCQHCMQDVEFTKLELTLTSDGKHYGLNSGHHFVEEDLILDKQFSFGSEKDVVVELNGKTLTANGSRVFNVSGGASLTIQGEGTITGGNSKGARGGNIYASGANLYLYGGTIINGTATGDGNNEGNNVAVYNGKFTMNGNVVIGNAADAEKAGHSLYLFNTTEASLINGTITGKALFRSVTGATLPASVSVDMLAMRDSKLIAVEERTDGAQIAVKVTNGTGAFLTGAFTEALENADAVMGYFVAANSEQVLVNEGGQLKVANPAVEPEPSEPAPSEPSEPTPSEPEPSEPAPSEPSEPTPSEPEPSEPAPSEPEPSEPTPSEPTPEPEPEPQPTVKTIYCQHCMQDVEFTELVVDGKNAKSGHYFLANDVSLEKVITVADGVDVVIELNDKNITANGCRAFSIGGASTLTIQGNGIISGGDAGTGRGGNIYASGANLYLYGGTIIGGTCPSNGNSEGNNVAVYNGKFTINGDVVIGNAADAEKNGCSVYLFNLTETNLTSGTVIGGVLFRGSYEFALPAAFNVDLIALRETKIASVEERAEKVAVKVTNAAGEYLNGLVSSNMENAEAALAYLKSASSSREIIVNTDAQLEIVSAAEIVYCVCGCGKPAEEIIWVDAAEYMAALKEAGTATITENVHLKLSADLDIPTAFGANKQIAIGGPDVKADPDKGVEASTAPDVKVVIDLNGFTWSATDRIYNYAGCVLTVLDTSAEGTGMMTSTGSGAKSGRVIANYGTFNLMSGTLTMTDAETLPATPAGGVVYQSTGVFNMYGGVIEGGMAANGGNVNIRQGEFNMYGGEIKDGSATDTGANVWLGADVTFNKTEGVIADEANTVYQAQ